MIDLTWLAGPLGLVGLAVALVFWRRNRSAHTTVSAGEPGSAGFLLKQYPIVTAVVVVLGLLLWPLVALSTALSFVGGAFLTMIAAAFVVKIVDDGSLSMASAASSGTGVESGRALALSMAAGLAMASAGVVGLGILYFLLVHSPAAFLQSELVDFGNITGGLALGASVVALLLSIVGGTFATAAGALEAPVVLPPDERSSTEQKAVRELGATTGAASTAADLLQSYLCASVAAIVIAGAGRIFSAQRVEAVALPILIGAIGLISCLIAIPAARALRSSNPARTLRTLGLLSTALFLVLAYLVVTSLGMEGQDPFTGRDYLLSGPFWAILAGSLAALGAGFATEFYTSWRPARRLAEGSGLGLGQTILWSFALGMESILIPTLLIAVATVVAYYFAGAYGIALAALGMLATAGITVGTAAYGPLVGSFDSAGSAGRGEPRPLAGATGAIAGSAEAIARGWSVAASALTSLALLAGYGYATGLWGIGIDLQSPLLLSGLLVGAALPVVTAALLLGGGRRAVAGLDAETASGSGASADGSKWHNLAQSARLPRKMVLPLLMTILLPPLVCYGLGVHAVAGLIAGGALSSLLLGLFLANSGSALVNAGIFVSANATAAEVHRVGAGSDDFGRALRDGCVAAMTIVVKLIGILSIVLVPWFVRIL